MSDCPGKSLSLDIINGVLEKFLQRRWVPNTKPEDIVINGYSVTAVNFRKISFVISMGVCYIGCKKTLGVQRKTTAQLLRYATQG